MMIGVWPKEILRSFPERAMFDQTVQRQMSSLAEAGCWDRRTRIVVAKKSYSVRLPLPIAKSNREGFMRAVPRQTSRVRQ